MITYKLRVAAPMTSAYRLRFRWHDHIHPECGNSNDISVQIAVQMV